MSRSAEMYGKVQNTFELQTDTLAIKWPLPVDKTSSWAAGDIVKFDGTAAGLVNIATTSTKAEDCIGVAMESFNTEIDEISNDKVTVVMGVFIARTTQYNSAAITTATAPGTLLYPSGTTAGVLDTISNRVTNSTPVARLLGCDGKFVKYIWIATDAVYSA